MRGGRKEVPESSWQPRPGMFECTGRSGRCPTPTFVLSESSRAASREQASWTMSGRTDGPTMSAILPPSPMFESGCPSANQSVKGGATMRCKRGVGGWWGNVCNTQLPQGTRTQRHTLLTSSLKRASPVWPMNQRRGRGGWGGLDCRTMGPNNRRGWGGQLHREGRCCYGPRGHRRRTPGRGAAAATLLSLCQS